ncbi:MAG: hypothetical protein AAFP90_08270 [Planctomycetota bacterium]
MSRRTQNVPNAPSFSAAKRTAIALLAIAGLFGCTGCQAVYNGQNLPSGYYLEDDVQYFEKGPEFKLSREAAALEADKARRAQQK